MAIPIRLTVNGKSVDAQVEPHTLLVQFLREQLRLTGTHVGCDTAQCGACTVHVDGVAMRSCGVTVSEMAGKEITTIEGLAAGGVMHKVQLAWIASDVPQCGYCQSGMIMAVAALLALGWGLRTLVSRGDLDVYQSSFNLGAKPSAQKPQQS